MHSTGVIRKSHVNRRVDGRTVFALGQHFNLRQQHRKTIQISLTMAVINQVSSKENDYRGILTDW
jgi:hypothetical protein